MDYLRIDREGQLRLATRKEINKDREFVAPHNEWTAYEGPVVWTGPDGKSHHRLKTFRDWQPVGVGEVPGEKTLSTTFISRAPSGTPFPRSRVNMIGEIGWWYNNYRGRLVKSQPIFQER